MLLNFRSFSFLHAQTAAKAWHWTLLKGLILNESFIQKSGMVSTAFQIYLY